MLPNRFNSFTEPPIRALAHRSSTKNVTTLKTLFFLFEPNLEELSVVLLTTNGTKPKMKTTFEILKEKLFSSNLTWNKNWQHNKIASFFAIVHRDRHSAVGTTFISLTGATQTNILLLIYPVHTTSKDWQSTPKTAKRPITRLVALLMTHLSEWWNMKCLELFTNDDKYYGL